MKKKPSQKSTFKKNFAAALKSTGLNQTDLSRLLGVTQPAVNRWINEKQLPTLEQAVLACQALEVSVDSLCGTIEKFEWSGDYLLRAIRHFVATLEETERKIFIQKVASLA